MADEAAQGGAQPQTPIQAAASQPGGMSVDDAVAALSRSSEQSRTPTGQFAAREQQTAPVVDIKTGKPAERPEQIGHNGGPELEEEFFEWAPEQEGAPPRRVKADEVFAAYEELPKLREELEQAKRAAPPPQQYMEQLQGVMEDRQRYIQALARAQHLGRPNPPDERFANPQDPAYDPDAYARQMYQYRQQMAGWQERNAHLEEQAAQHEKAQQQHVRMLQQMAEPEIYKVWPEMRDPAKRDVEFAEMERVLGIKREQLNGITDPRIWGVVKDALSFRRGQKSQAEAVKVARAKPKLVKGTARQATTSTSRQPLWDSLAQSGSEEAAVAFLSRKD